MRFEWSQEKAAANLVKHKTDSRSPWTCATCGESIEAEFDQCWNCLTSRTSTQKDE